MRVCLVVEGQEGVAWEQWVALARACEESGLEGLFASDHYLATIGSGSERGGLDAWTTLAGLAAATQRIRLGTLVSPVTFRHPSVLAKAVATVDHVSGGRVELGLGAGWHEDEHRAYGFRFPEIGDRMDVLAEQLAIVVRLWTEDVVTFEGHHYRLDDCRALPKPVQRPRPPVIIGGAGGPRSVRLAVRFADEYNAFYTTAEECRERRQRLDAACERAGRDPASLALSLMVTAAIGSDRGEVVARARELLRLFGDPDADPEELLRERSGVWVTGTVDEAAARLRELAAAGVERVYLQHLLPGDVEMVELVGRELVPAV